MGGGQNTGNVTIQNYNVTCVDYDNSETFLTSLDINNASSMFAAGSENVLRVITPVKNRLEVESNNSETPQYQSYFYTSNRSIKCIIDMQFKTEASKCVISVLNTVCTDPDFLINHPLNGSQFTSNLYAKIKTLIDFQSSSESVITAIYKPFIKKVWYK